MKDTQKNAVLKYIREHGSITPMEAWDNLGITKLSSIVSDMRLKDRIEIKIEKIPSVNRYGHHVKYCRYSLPEEEA